MSFVYYSIVLDGGSDSSLMALGRNSVLVGASAFDFRSQIEFVSLREVAILYDWPGSGCTAYGLIFCT